MEKTPTSTKRQVCMLLSLPSPNNLLPFPLFAMRQKISCVFEGRNTFLTHARVHGAIPNPIPPPQPPAVHGQTHQKKPWLSVYISMYSHTFFSNPNTKPIIETVGKRHFGSQGRSNQPSKH